MSESGCPICGAPAAGPASNAVISCANGHVFSLNEDIPSSPEVTQEHWDELRRRWT